MTHWPVTTGTTCITGNAGDDTLKGNAGADTLNGGPGADTLDGGSSLSGDIMGPLTTQVMIRNTWISHPTPEQWQALQWT